MKTAIWILLIVVLGSCKKDKITPDAINPQDPLPQADFQKISVSDFSDEELDLPYYVKHFGQVANSVIMDGPNKGFINISVWRNYADNQPYNARVMENILSLTYFYCTNRPWNPYYEHPGLRARLEAALEYWCSIQNNSGQFSEYAYNQWGLAPTAFATKFMGEALRLLHSNPKINAAILAKAMEADRKALYFIFTDAAFYTHGKKYSNQYTNAIAGALAYLDIKDDSEIRQLLYKKIKECHDDLQSPVGFFYESHGPDWSYNLNTHQSNLLMTSHYAQNTDLEDYLRDEETRFVDWLSYNAVPEPDNSGYVLNRSIETRQLLPYLEKYGAFLKPTQGMFVYKLAPLSAAFIITQTERNTLITQSRESLNNNWPEVGSLDIANFSAFSPYAFLHRTHDKYFPTQPEQDAAMALLPYNKSTSFIHQRMDSRNPVTFTYVRKPGYYAVFNSGKIITTQQRLGLGLLWFPSTGAIIQSQTGSATGAWGTTLTNEYQCIESSTLNATFTIDQTSANPQIGNHNLSGNTLQVTYPISSGKKTIRFNDNNIVIDIQYNGQFKERIPILIKTGEAITINGNQVSIVKNGKTTIIQTNASNVQNISSSYTCGKNNVWIITLDATNNLTYTITPPQD